MADRNRRTVDRRKVLAGLTTGGAVFVAGCIGGGGDDGGDDSGSGGSDSDSGGSDSGDSGSGDSGSDSGSDSDSGSSVEPTVWGWDNAADALDTVGDFYEEDTGNTVTVESFSRGDMKTEFLNTLDSGSGYPDSAMMESIDGPSWIETEGLRDLSAWIEEDGLRSEFVSGKWQALSDGDAIYALPWDIGPVGTFYRRTLFEEQGIDPDSIETWDDFLAAGEGFADSDGQYLVNVPPNDYAGFWRMQFRQLGGAPFTEDGAVNIDSETSLRVAKQMQTLLESDLVGSFQSFGGDWNTALEDGTLASITSGSWMEGFLPEVDGGWGVMKPPAYESGGNRSTNWGGSNLVIPAGVSDEAARAAWEYMKYALATESSQAQMLRDFGLFPAYQPAFESDAISIEKPKMGGQSTGELYAEIAPNIEGYRYTVDTPAVSTAINEQFGMMADGQKAPEQVLEDAAQQVADETGRERA